MRSKRGGTLAVEEIVKLVIGIGVLIFILFILFALGKIVTSSLKEEQAKNTLDNIVFEIEKANKNNIDSTSIASSFNIIVEGPKKWILIYNQSDNLCICDWVLVFEDIDKKSTASLLEGKGSNMDYNLRESCIRLGTCKKVSPSYISPSSCNGLGLNILSIDSCFFIEKVPSDIRFIVGESIENIFPTTSGGSVLRA
jgi:hypothetical protein